MKIIDAVPPRREMPPDVATSVWAQVERGIVAGTASPPSPRRRGWLHAGLGAAAAAAAASVLIIQPWAADNAYASWTAVPDQVGSSTLHSLGATCVTHQRTHFRQAIAMHAVVGEQRGHFHAVLLGGAGALSACVGVPNGELGGLTQLGGAPAASPIALDANPGLLSGPDAFRVAYGRIGAPVAKVVVTTADGRSVTASTGNGYFLAWWPSGAAAGTVTAFNARGALLGHVNAPRDVSPTPRHS